jgi:glycosyltransferase involved in cell wall biosynthesis
MTLNQPINTLTNHQVNEPPNYLVFSDDWGEHPSSCQHLFKHIAKDHQTLWVNTIGMRSPQLTLTDLKKALKKVGKMISGDNTGGTLKVITPEKLSVVQPFMLPYAHIGLIRRFNKWSVVWTVRRKLKQMGLQQPVLVTTVPNACDYVGCFNEQKAVYYCVDDFAHWPGHDKDYITSLEDELCRKADIFVATSQKLYERLQKTGKPTHLLTHGVEVEHFSYLPAEEHPCLKDIPEPRVGYFGLIDERMDQNLLYEVARELPDVSFVLTGRVETDCSRLQEQKNVYFTGPVTYQELPAVLSGWDVCMLPYKVNELSMSINPLKLKEYLAAGKPVVSTPLPTVQSLGGYIRTAEGATQWVVALQALLDETAPADGDESEGRKKEAFIQQEDWQMKAGDFLRMIKGNDASEVESHHQSAVER